MTYTYVIMQVSRRTYDEIAAQMRAADYGHAFHDHHSRGTVLDMHGIALQPRPVEVVADDPVPTWRCQKCGEQATWPPPIGLHVGCGGAIVNAHD